MEVLLSNMLDYQLFKDGHFTIQYSLLDCSILLHGIVEKQRVRWMMKAHIVDIVVESQMPLIYVDARILSKVLNVLFDNALKHTGNGSRIMLSCKFLRNITHAENGQLPMGSASERSSEPSSSSSSTINSCTSSSSSSSPSSPSIILHESSLRSPASNSNNGSSSPEATLQHHGLLITASNESDQGTTQTSSPSSLLAAPQSIFASSPTNNTSFPSTAQIERGICEFRSVIMAVASLLLHSMNWNHQHIKWIHQLPDRPVEDWIRI